MEPSVTMDTHGWLVHNARALQSLAHKLVRGDDAEDLVQETLARGLERPPREMKSGTWLRVVCRNLFIARRRHEERRSAFESRVAATATAPDTFDVVAHRAAVERLIGALHELSPDAYQVIQLRFYEDLIPTAIAARLSLPLSTVKRRLERALQHLRESLGAHEERSDHDWRHALLPLLASRDAAIGSTVIAAAWSASRLVWAASAVIVTAATVWLTMPWTGRAADERPRVAAVRPRALVVPQQEPARVERAIVSTSTDHSDAQPGHGSLRVAVTWPDGTKAARLPFMVMLYPDTEVVVDNQVMATTDADGVAMLGDLPAGKATVYVPDPQVGGRAEIRAGEEASVAIAITRGINVEGEVVTCEGTPVPDAEIRLGNYNESYPMMRTDADGKFALRDVCRMRQVFARAKNLAPSRAMQIEGKAGEKVHVRLELAGPGGAVSGTVRNSDGEPVAGARVTLTPSEEAPYYQPRSQSAPRATVFTGEDGEFRCEGMSPGQLPAVVRARPYAPWKGLIDVTADATTSVDVHLQEGAILEGTVRDQAGTPLADAHVTVTWNEDKFAADAKTESDGSYRLIALPIGEYAVCATHENVGRSEATLVGVAGQIGRWDVVLDAGSTIRGVVIDERGAPVAAARVNASPSGSSVGQTGWRAQSRTDASGRFVITNCPDAKPGDPPLTFRLSVSCADDATRRALVPSVQANGEAVTIQLGRDGVASAFVEALFVEQDGSPAAASVYARGGPSGLHEIRDNDPTTGKLRLGPWPAGRYELQLKRKPMGLLDERTIDVAENEVKDLGTIALHATGSLDLAIERPPGFEGKLVVKVTSKGARWDIFGMTTHEDPDIPAHIVLGPGAYYVIVSGSAITEVVKPFTIESSTATQVTVRVERNGGN